MNEAHKDVPDNSGVRQLTFNEHIEIQFFLIERYVENGGNELDWTEKYAVKFRDLIENDPELRRLAIDAPEKATAKIEERLKNV